MADDEGSQMADGGSAQKLPLNFGKRLVHTDKHVRDRGFKILRAWLEKHKQLGRLDYMKLWKGLFYGVWMSDKRPVQQELSVNIALLINLIPDANQIMWFATFWETMMGALENLDKHRMNKYLLFLRIMLAELFKVLRLHGWDVAELREVATIFTQSVPDRPRSGHNVPSMGLFLHVTRMFWDELQPQVKEEPALSAEGIMAFLERFCVLAEGCSLDVVVRSIHLNVFRKTPPKYREALVKRILDSAAKEELEKKNRDALYETADDLEQEEVAAGRMTKRERFFVAPGPAPKQTKPLVPPKKVKKRRRKAAVSKEEAKEEEAKEGADDAPAAEGSESAEAAIKAKKKKRRKTLV